MTDYTHALGDGVTLVLSVLENSTSIPDNTSSLSWSLKINKGSNSPWASNPSSWSVNIGGKTASGTATYDFRSTSSKTLGSGSGTVITHNSDGTKSISVSGSFNDGGTLLGDGTASGTKALSTIPRSSTPTFSPNPVDCGTATTITTNRADASFTHDISYAIGSVGPVSIGTGIGASTTWTPPLTLMTQFPNSTSANVTITTNTYTSGGTFIGTTTTSITISAPATAVPSFTSITDSETVSTVSSIVGAYVQSLSKVALAITGAAGIYGSTITAYKLTVAGQTINASSGTTDPIASSGTVVVTGTVTDSRGRTHSSTKNLTVMAYVGPSIDTTVFQLRRSLSDGTVAIDSGTYVRVDLKAASQSLIVSSTQKNSLTYKIESRQRGTSTWTTKETTTVPSSGVTYNSFTVESTYDITLAWEFQITVSDKFNSVVSSGTVSTAAVFMHWGTGLALGKFWERGGLDVQGTIYQNAGARVLDTTDLATIASNLAATIPPGIVLNTIVAAAPTGWLLCNGSAVSRTTYASLFAATNTNKGTTTVTIASPGVFTLASHGLAVGDRVAFTTTGALPTGITAGTSYYVSTVPTGSTYTVSATRGGTVINTTGTQSGTHTMWLTPFGFGDGSTTFNVPDLRGSVIMGIDASQTEFANRGKTGGAKTNSLPLSLNGGAQMFLDSTHTWVIRGGPTMPAAANNTESTTWSGTATIGSPGSTVALIGNTDAGPTLPPYVAMHYIIKT